MAFEVGIKQSESVADIMKTAGFKNVSTRADLNEVDRVVFGTLDVI